MSHRLDDLESYLRRKIVLARAMDLRVLREEGDLGFVIEAPVAANLNHLGTAFGGSINAIATLAAYSALWLRLGENDHVVVAASEIQFLRPIRQTIRARCDPLSSPVAKRVTIGVKVFDGAEPMIAANFRGEFAIVSRA